ncbi:MAG: 50S ribosomal protein L6 [Elusimicrobia bacterium]|nr:50S ribosomal protein L6 [Elusimicrobiota bacterium]
MSRIGRTPVAIPPQVKVEVVSERVHVKGPLGEMSMSLPGSLAFELKDGKIFLSLRQKEIQRQDKAIYGTTRARLANLVKGVQEAFSKVLEIQGLGFKASLEGSDKLSLSIGYARPVIFQIPTGVKLQVDPKQTVITISGSDKDLVGETAARIRRIRCPEPYKGTGIRYRGEHITRKAGKTAAGAVGAGAGGGAKK